MFPKKLTRQVICEPDQAVVETGAGKLHGIVTEGTFIFRGVKYGEQKRFHPPTPVKPWQGVMEATVYGAVCPEIKTPVAHDQFPVPHFWYPQDEDCLYLNIWTRSLDRDAKKPVIVWIHGGGWNSGSGIELYAYDGEEISAFGDVVYVSLNHRNGLLGFLDLSDFGEEYRTSNITCLQDLTLALAWIRENIAAFGGDPGNVTLAGQSGGGGKICALMNMPAARGLFHKAIIESGIGTGEERITKEHTRQVGRVTVEKLGLAQETIGEIEKIPFYKIARAANAALAQVSAETGVPQAWQSVPCGEDFRGVAGPGHFSPETAQIPMIVGSNFGEFNSNFNGTHLDGKKNSWTEAQKMPLLRERFGEDAEKTLEAFRKAWPEKNTADLLYMDTRMRRSHLRFAQARAGECGARIWNYLFSLEMPMNNGTTPWHNAEEPYALHNACYHEASYIPGVSEALQDQMCGAWVAFARNGDPNHPGLPVWEPFEPDQPVTMIFDRETRVGHGHDAALLDLIRPSSKEKTPRKSTALGGGPRQSK